MFTNFLLFSYRVGFALTASIYFINYG